MRICPRGEKPLRRLEVCVAATLPRINRVGQRGCPKDSATRLPRKAMGERTVDCDERYVGRAVDAQEWAVALRWSLERWFPDGKYTTKGKQRVEMLEGTLECRGEIVDRYVIGDTIDVFNDGLHRQQARCGLG